MKAVVAQNRILAGSLSHEEALVIEIKTIEDYQSSDGPSVAELHDTARRDRVVAIKQVLGATGWSLVDARNFVVHRLLGEKTPLQKTIDLFAEKIKEVYTLKTGYQWCSLRHCGVHIFLTNRPNSYNETVESVMDALNCNMAVAVEIVWGIQKLLGWGEEEGVTP